MKKLYKLLSFLASVCIALGFIALAITIGLLFNDGKVSWFTSLNLEDASKVGDFVGGFVGVFWSIAGILLLFITLRMQSDEFEATRKAITKQQFETTFFNMLTVLGNIRSQIKYKINGETKGNIESHEFMAYALGKLTEAYTSELSNKANLKNELNSIEEKIDKILPITDLDISVLKDSLNKIYLDFYSNYHAELGHYFRYVYNLMKFTINNRKAENDEKLYLDLIQAQLSNDEMGLIFYNSLSEKGANQNKKQQFHEWMEEYSFLENIDVNSLIKKSHHKLFPKTIFKFLNLDEVKEKETNNK